MLAKVLAGANHQHRGQGGGARGEVDHQPAGKIEDPAGREPAAGPPDPMTDRIVDHDGPEQGKDHEGGEAHPFGKGAGDQGRGDDGKHALIDHEYVLRDGGGIGGAGVRAHGVQAEPGQAPHHPLQIGAKGHGIPQQHPLDTDHRDHDQALHESAQHVFAPDHAPVKEGQARGHEQDKSGRGQDKGGIPVVDH